MAASYILKIAILLAIAVWAAYGAPEPETERQRRAVVFGSRSGSWSSSLYYRNEGVVYGSVPRDEVIQSMELWEEDIPPSGVTHEFVLFRTTRAWWSIEKTRQGISMQRSGNKQFVQNYYRGASRSSPITMLSGPHSTSARTTTGQVVNWLNLTNELTRGYNLFTDNCYFFTGRVLRRFT